MSRSISACGIDAHDLEICFFERPSIIKHVSHQFCFFYPFAHKFFFFFFLLELSHCSGEQGDTTPTMPGWTKAGRTLVHCGHPVVDKIDESEKFDVLGLNGL
jgi:hypothetical protein